MVPDGNGSNQTVHRGTNRNTTVAPQAIDTGGGYVQIERNRVADPGAFRRRRVYPRLVVSAVDSAFASGALSRRRDGELIAKLHAWRDTVNTVNRRLDLTESLTFATSSTDEVEAFNRALHRSDGYLTGARALLAELQSYLDTTWKAR